ncbi:MAG TPA: hypothetical protein VGH38_12820 [Bryobacteraceae bacterium]
MGRSGVCHAALPRAVVLCATFLAAPTWAATSIGGAQGLTVSVDSTGSYTVALPSLGWRFAGSTGTPASNIAVASGVDGAGSYLEIAFDFRSTVSRHATIRSYQNRPAILFTLTSLSAVANTFSFPSLSQFPQNLQHISYSGMFAAPTFGGLDGKSPWVFFDYAGNTFIISPASNFMTANTAWGPKGELATGISPQIATLPQGFIQQTLLVMDKGINHTFDTWGQALTALHGKVRPLNDADASLNQIGYWTDAGAAYYYKLAPGLSYQDTLTAVRADFTRVGIAPAYLQLDSWFYPKGSSADWADMSDGMYGYLAATTLFGSGLSSFSRNLGVDLITHARWIDANSPLRALYQVSGNVAIDPRYWADISSYLAQSGAVTYEQDWLANKAQTDFNLTDPDAFLDNMAAGMAQHGITIQYCTPDPRHVLQSSKYNNVTSIRVSQDRFNRSRWTEFLYASRFASALGTYPFTDVFMSAELENLLVATLSAGPVGVGDPVGAMNGANLQQAVRLDGVIVKPDVPITPIDASYQSDAQSHKAPLIASTYTDFGGLKTIYVFAYVQGPDTQLNVQPSSLGIDSPVYLYDYRNDSGMVLDPARTIIRNIDNDWTYLVAAPVGPSGIAVLGDRGQFVGVGKKRVVDLRDDGVVHLTVAFAKDEKYRTLQGYSPDQPVTNTLSGRIRQFQYDSTTHMFTIQVAPCAEGSATIELTRGGATLFSAPEAPAAPGSPAPPRRIHPLPR